MQKSQVHYYTARFKITCEDVFTKNISNSYVTLNINENNYPFKATSDLKNYNNSNYQVQVKRMQAVYDQTTGLYETKKALIVLEYQVKGSPKLKLGQVPLNLGTLLNERKKKLTNIFPLGKLSTKGGTIKLKVEFEREKDKNQSLARSNATSRGEQEGRLLALRSKLVEEENQMLSNKVRQYERRVDECKDQHITLNNKYNEQLAKKEQKMLNINQELSNISRALEQANQSNESLKKHTEIQKKQIIKLSNEIQSLQLSIKNLRNINENLSIEYDTLKSSYDNIVKSKEQKQKHYLIQIQKYSKKYSQAQQSKYKTVFVMEQKLKDEISKKDNYIQQLLEKQLNKYNQYRQQKNLQLQESQKLKIEAQEKLIQALGQITILKQKIKENEEIIVENNRKKTQDKIQYSNLKKNNKSLSGQLETLQFSYREMAKQLSYKNEEIRLQVQSIQQLKTQLQTAVSTIQQQSEQLNKLKKQIQSYQERQYYLRQNYQNQLQIKTIDNEVISNEKNNYWNTLQRVINEKDILQSKIDNLQHKQVITYNQLQQFQIQNTRKNKTILQITQKKLVLESQCRKKNQDINQLKEQLNASINEQNHLRNIIRDKKYSLDNDRVLQWTVKIENLQNDIAQMVEKFRQDKNAMREGFRQHEEEREEQINKLTLLHQETLSQSESLLRKNVELKARQVQLEKKSLQWEYKYTQKNQDYNLATLELNRQAKVCQELEEQLRRKDKNIQFAKDTFSKAQKELQRILAQKNALINSVMEYLAKPPHHELHFIELYGEDNGHINFALRKHCETHNRTKDYIKQLELKLQKQASALTYKVLPNLLDNEPILKNLDTVPISNHNSQMNMIKLNKEEELRQVNQNYMSEIGELKEQIFKLKMQYQLSQNLVNNLEHEIQNCNQDKMQIWKHNQQLIQQNNNHTQTIIKLNKNNQQLVNQQQQLNKKIRIQKRIFKKSQEDNISSNKFKQEYMTLQRQVQNIKMKLKKQSQKNQEKQKLIQNYRKQKQIQSAKLAKQIQKYMEINKNLQKEKQILNETLSNWKKYNEALTQEKALLSVTLQDSQHKYKEEKEEHEKLIREHSGCSKVEAKMQKDYENRINQAIAEEKDTLAKALIDMESLRAECGSRVQMLEREKQRLNTKIQRLQKSVEASIHEQERLRDQNELLNAKCELLEQANQWEGRYMLLQIELKEKDRKLQELSNDFEEYKFFTEGKIIQLQSNGKAF